MKSIAEWLRRRLERFRSDQSGNLAVIFALSLLPVLTGIGAAVDYTRVADVRGKLNGAADLSTLAAVSKDAQPFTNTPTQAGVSKYFNTIASTIPNLNITNVTVSVNRSVTNLSVTLTYTGQVNTVFAGILGISSVTVGGTSTAQVNAPPYANFYLLLDNSPSMGLGATPADITNLITATSSQSPTTFPNCGTSSGCSIPRSSCAFACHQHTFTSSGKITGDDLNDNYHVAKANNITTRIDVMRSATQALTQTATQDSTMANQFGMAVYTFSDTFQTVAPMSTSMSQVSSNASAIDLAYAYWNARDAQTSFDTALSYINGIMPNPGSGASSSTPQEYLFIVTDGLADMPVQSNSGSGDPADPPSSYLPLNNQANVANSLTGGNDGSGRLLSTLTPSAISSPSQPQSLSQDYCTEIKSRGITIAVLYTPYQPVTNNAFYMQYVNPVNSSPVNPNNVQDPAGNIIGQQLQACASSGFYFQVTPTTGIAQAMQQMFQAAIQAVLLTN